MEKLMLTVEEMGEVMGVGRKKAYELANSEGFPAIRIGKSIRVPKEALQRWVSERTPEIGKVG